MITYRHIVGAVESEISPVQMDDIDQLLRQLKPGVNCPSLGYMQKVINNSHFLVAEDRSRVIGMGTLILSFAPIELRAHIEDVVVDRNYCNHGIGRKIMTTLIDYGKNIGVKRFNLTSNPRRTAANRLYESLGFKKRDTNLYVLY